jgi:hypothetical protein
VARKKFVHQQRTLVVRTSVTKSDRLQLWDAAGRCRVLRAAEHARHSAADDNGVDNFHSAV